MDGTITFSKGVVCYTTEKTGSDEFVFVCLEKYFGKIPDGAAIVRKPGEKPYLKPRFAEFSLSHTKGFLCAAFSDAPVGIDVENRNRFRLKAPDATPENAASVRSDGGNETEAESGNHCGKNPTEATEAGNAADCEQNSAAGIDKYDPIFCGTNLSNTRETPDRCRCDGGNKTEAESGNRCGKNQSEATEKEELFRERGTDDPVALARCRAVGERFFRTKVETTEEFLRLWTKQEALAKRDGVPLLESRADGAVSYFTVGSFLIAVAVSG